MGDELNLEERHRLERELWDEYVQRPGPGQQLVVPRVPVERLHPANRWALEHLGDLRGKRVLDFGCGTGRASVYLAFLGAQVCGFDISPKSIETAQRRAEINGVAGQTEFRVMSGEQLAYEDASFDCVFGQSILHHVVLDTAAREIHRVLKPRGRAAFYEPQGTNPLMRLVRAGIPYPGKKRHGTDQPLRGRDVDILRRHFAAVETRPFTLLSGVEKMLGFRWSFPWLRRFDERLLHWCPWLAWAYVYIVIRLQK